MQLLFQVNFLFGYAKILVKLENFMYFRNFQATRVNSTKICVTLSIFFAVNNFKCHNSLFDSALPAFMSEVPCLFGVLKTS